MFYLGGEKRESIILDQDMWKLEAIVSGLCSCFGSRSRLLQTNTHHTSGYDKYFGTGTESHGKRCRVREGSGQKPLQRNGAEHVLLSTSTLKKNSSLVYLGMCYSPAPFVCYGT